MSTVDERDLGERLSGVLDAITPSAAPVAATLRTGKLIRARRNIGITAGLAVAAGFALAAPALVHQPARPAGTPVRPTVMVRPLCLSVPHGVRDQRARHSVGLENTIQSVTCGSPYHSP